MAKVVLKNLEKIYSGRTKVLHGIDLEIEDGEFMVFVGPSGCAKSTTLRMVAGLEEISSGEIYIGDKLVNKLKPKDRGIAMVFQNYALYPHMNTYKNMAFALKMAKLPKDEIDRRVKDAAEKLEITSLLNRKPKEMSGGQRQRVALGRAIVRKPQVFLFDEPLSNLDAKLRVSMRLKISQLHKELNANKEKATMIYVTHDQVEAMTMGDRICVMNEGKIMQVDTPLNIYNHPRNKFVASFIGSPSMNFISGKLVKEREKIHFEFNRDNFIDLTQFEEKISNYINKEVILGIRPEKVYLTDESNGFEGRVNIVENMGSEAFVYFNLGEIELKLKIENLNKIDTKYDSKIFINFNIDGLALFDKITENNILY